MGTREEDDGSSDSTASDGTAGVGPRSSRGGDESGRTTPQQDSSSGRWDFVGTKPHWLPTRLRLWTDDVAASAWRRGLLARLQSDVRTSGMGREEALVQDVERRTAELMARYEADADGGWVGGPPFQGLGLIMLPSSHRVWCKFYSSNEEFQVQERGATTPEVVPWRRIAQAGGRQISWFNEP